MTGVQKFLLKSIEQQTLEALLRIEKMIMEVVMERKAQRATPPAAMVKKKSNASGTN